MAYDMRHFAAHIFMAVLFKRRYFLEIFECCNATFLHGFQQTRPWCEGEGRCWLTSAVLGELVVNTGYVSVIRDHPITQFDNF